MSWNNVVPWWVYSCEYEEYEAKMLCAFDAEVLSGYTRSTPNYVAEIIQQRKKRETEDEMLGNL